jgi:hypothetical protein
MGAISKVQQIRQDAGLSMTAAAALAGVAPHTWKIYELSEEAVRDRKKRAACDAATAKLAEIAKEKAA